MYFRTRLELGNAWTHTVNRHSKTRIKTCCCVGDEADGLWRFSPRVASQVARNHRSARLTFFHGEINTQGRFSLFHRQKGALLINSIINEPRSIISDTRSALARTNFLEPCTHICSEIYRGDTQRPIYDKLFLK